MCGRRNIPEGSEVVGADFIHPAFPMLLPDLPDHARLWIFTADRTLSASEQARLCGTVERFVATWASHGRPVPGGALLLEDRFVVVAAHPEGGVSGCGIDSLVHAVEAAGDDVGVAWVDGLQVVYRDADGEVRVLPRPAFRRLAREGTVTAATSVFDTTLATLGDLRSAGLERPAGSAWHGRAFRLAELARAE